MIEVLEVPVFLSDFSYASGLFQKQEIMESENNGFKYCIHSLNGEKEIIFYFFVVKETIDNSVVFDRLVPKAPYCHIILKGETFIINNFCESYKERYSNPLVCLFPQGKNDFDLTYIKNNILKNEDNHLLEYQPDDPAELNRILIASLNHLLKNQE